MIIVRFQMSNNCQFNRQRHSIRKCALFYWNIEWLYSILQNTKRQTQLNVNYIQCYTHVVMASIQPKSYIQLYPWEQCSIRSHIAPTYLLYGTAPSQNHVWRIWILDSKIATKQQQKNVQWDIRVLPFEQSKSISVDHLVSLSRMRSAQRRIRKDNMYAYDIRWMFPSHVLVMG